MLDQWNPKNPAKCASIEETFRSFAVSMPFTSVVIKARASYWPGRKCGAGSFCFTLRLAFFLKTYSLSLILIDSATFKGHLEFFVDWFFIAQSIILMFTCFLACIFRGQNECEMEYLTIERMDDTSLREWACISFYKVSSSIFGSVFFCDRKLWRNLDNTIYCAVGLKVSVLYWSLLIILSNKFYNFVFVLFICLPV